MPEATSLISEFESAVIEICHVLHINQSTTQFCSNGWLKDTFILIVVYFHITASTKKEKPQHSRKTETTGNTLRKQNTVCQVGCSSGKSIQENRTVQVRLAHHSSARWINPPTNLHPGQPTDWQNWHRQWITLKTTVRMVKFMLRL